MARQNTHRLFWDLETVAMPNVENWIPEPKIPGNLKDPVKIEAKRTELFDTAVERAGLDADLCTIKLIAMKIDNNGSLPTALLVRDTKDQPALDILTSALQQDMDKAGLLGKVEIMTEKDAIEKFWEMLAFCNGNSIGYNTLGFDFPVIMRRSFDLGINPGITPNLAKYRTYPTLDLFGVLNNWAWGTGKKMKWIAKRYDLPILAEEADGSMVEGMSDLDLVRYGLSDISVTIGLYNKMNGIYFTHF